MTTNQDARAAFVALRAPYTLAEIEAKIASHDYNAELMLQHAMLLLRAESAEQRAAPDGWTLTFADERDFCLAASPLIGAAYGDAAAAVERINTSPWGRKTFGKVSAASPAAPAPCAMVGLTEATADLCDAVDGMLEWCVKNVNRWNFGTYDALHAANKRARAFCQKNKLTFEDQSNG